MAVQDTVSSPSSRQDLSSLADWLRLARTPGITRLTANLLLAEYGSPQAVLAAARQVLLSSVSDASPSAAEGPPASGRAPSEPAAACLPSDTDSPTPSRLTAAADAAFVARADDEGRDDNSAASVGSARNAGGAGAARERDGAWCEAEDDGAGEDDGSAEGPKQRKRIVVREGDKVRMNLPAAKLLCASLPADARRELEAAKLWLQGEGNTIITQADKEYPPLLRHIPDPPLILYVKGNVQLLQNDALAIVGSRNATHQGRTHAEDIARAVSSEGMTIVSGLALGIDAAAHAGGLHAKGSTIAVVGTGIDRIYPARNADLARAIAQQGCLVSEFALGAPARPYNFPIRNRIIAGIARATLVVEATARSGSRITAHQAMHFGREVLVMPGSVQSPFSQGSHALIREGARLAGSAQHVLEDLGLRAPESVSFILTGTASELLEQLSFDPISADELATRLQLDPAQTQASLLALELAGVVERLPGGAFQRAK